MILLQPAGVAIALSWVQSISFCIIGCRWCSELLGGFKVERAICLHWASNFLFSFFDY